MTSLSVWNARRRRALIASGLFLMLAAALIAAVARHPLDGSPVLAIVRRSFTDSIGAKVDLARVRLDLLLSRGLVVEEFELRFQSWTLSVPRCVVRLDLGALLDGELRPSLSARRFVLRTDAVDGAEAMLRLRELLDVLGFPEASLHLSGGELITRNGTSLLEAIVFELEDGIAGRRFSGRAQQRGGGSLDVQGSERAATGELLLDVYLDGLSTDALRRWLSIAGLDSPQIPRLRGTAEGYWFIRLGAGHARHQHEFGINIVALEAARRPVRPRLPRMTAHLTGRLLTEYARVLDPSAPPGVLAFAEGSFVRVDASLGRLRTTRASGDEDGDAARMLFSGPLVATLTPRGRADRPRVVGHIELDDAHVRLGQWLLKPCGTAARLRFESETPPGAARVTRIGLDLGNAHAQARIEADGRLIGATDWIAGEDLGRWLPALEHRISGGRVRLVEFSLASPSGFEATLEFDEAAFRGRRMPFELDALSGVVGLSVNGFEAQALEARVSGIPLRVDLAGRVAGGDQPLKLRFTVQSDEIDLERAGLASDQARGESVAVSETLPPAFSRFAEANIALLRRERGWLSRVEVERGRFVSPAIRSRGQTLRNLELELAFRSLRLEVVRLTFHQQGARQVVSGMIDLNPLVPDIRMAALAQ